MLELVKKYKNLLIQYGSTPLNSGATIADLIRRPELHYNILAPIDENRPQIPEEVAEQVDINIKYDGYIKRQMRQWNSSRRWRKRKYRRILIITM